MTQLGPNRPYRAVGTPQIASDALPEGLLASMVIDLVPQSPS